MVGHDWPREARGVAAPIAGKAERTVATGTRTNPHVFGGKGQGPVAQSPHGAHSWRSRHSGDARCLRRPLANPDVGLGAGSFDSVREYCQPFAGTGNGTKVGNFCAYGARRQALKNRSAIADGEPAPFWIRQTCGAGAGLCRNANVVGVSLSRRAIPAYSRGAVG